MTKQEAIEWIEDEINRLSGVPSVLSAPLIGVYEDCLEIVQQIDSIKESEEEE